MTGVVRLGVPGGLVCFVGENGHGKDLAAIELMVLPALRAGLPVASNLTIDVERLGVDPSNFVRLKSWRQLPFLGVQEDPSRSITGNRPCVMLLSEASACIPARMWADTPAELLRVGDQWRKQEVAEAITVPNVWKVEKSFRGVLHTVVVCEGRRPDLWLRDTSRPKRAGLAGLVAPGWPVLRDDRGRKVPYSGFWPPNRVFDLRAYKAGDFERWADDPAQFEEAGRLRPLLSVTLNRNRSVAQELYRTREQVDLLDWVQDGVCVHCGLKVKTQRFCAGDHVGEAVELPEPEAAPPAAPAVAEQAGRRRRGPGVAA